MSKLKYAIIGSGTMGQEHIKNINLIDNAEVVAVCDSHKKSIDLSTKLLEKKVYLISIICGNAWESNPALQFCYRQRL